MASNLNLSLILRMVDNASAPLRQFNNRLEAMQAPVRRLGGELNRTMAIGGINRMRAGISGIGREMLSLSKTAAFTGAAVAGMGALFVKNQLLDTAAEFETLKISMESVMGSAEAGKKATEWLNKFAEKTPLNTITAQKAFMLLKNAGIDPMNGSLMALVDANAKLNGNQENMIEITRQLGQSWMKNKLQMEEVNVLTERGVKVIPLLAKAMGKSEQAVMALISKGKIGRKELVLFFRALAEDSKGSAEKQSRSWTGMLSTLSDKWDNFKNMIMDAGLFDWMRGKLANLLALLDRMAADGSLEAWAQKVGKALKSGFEGAWQAAKSVHESISKLADLVGGFSNLAKISLGVVTAIMTGPLLLAVAQLTQGMVMLTTAFVANPILLAIVAIGAAIALVALNWDTLTQSFLEGITAVASWLKSTLLGAVESVIDRVMGIGRAIKTLLPAANAPVMGKAATTLSGSGTRPGFMTPQARVDTGGTLNIRLDQDGKVKVTGLKTNDPRMNYNVDAGLTMAGAR